MKYLKRRLREAVAILGALGLIIFGAGSLALADNSNSANNQSNGTQYFQAVLTPLNGSNATGVATATIDAQGTGHFHIIAHNLINAPHAQHVHFGTAATHECPVPSADTNGDGVISTQEGGSAYGPVQTSLTTSGDTSAASTLAVTRYPTYANGAQYDRTFKLTADQAQGIRSGLSAVVIHGIDTIQPDGKYDGNIKSELDPSLPMEATAPAACGFLHEVTAASFMGTSNNSSNNGASKGVAYAALVIGIIALLAALASLMRRPSRA